MAEVEKMTKAVRPRIKFTYKDYKSLPESETKRYELLGGELTLVPSSSPLNRGLVIIKNCRVWN